MSLVQPLRISYIELLCHTRDSIASIEIVYDGHRRSIRRREKHHFHEDFNHPLTIRDETISFLIVRRRKWYIGAKQPPELIEINVHDVLSKLPTQKFQTVHNRLVITLGLPPHSVPTDTGSTSNANTVHPTSQELLDDRSRFRILIIGQPGVGKTTLINRTFGIEQAPAENPELGQANIEKELISPQNDRLILHASKGFDPANDVKYEDVKAFIEKRKRQEHIKDRLHAVWLCFRTPVADHGDKLLEQDAMAFLKEHTAVLQNSEPSLPLVLISQIKKADPCAAAKQYLQKNCIRPIQDFVKCAPLSYVAVSSNPGYERERNQLIELTHDMVTATFGLYLGAPSSVPVLTQMAQRVSRSLKIEGSITYALLICHHIMA
ncbi:hypothetical protein EDD16DRAFT_114033 [Pisolithus croceorrhizus]|nr:hypothetical protein EDD16DRAFT_114033 [Pisolithus croceorrhizus]